MAVAEKYRGAFPAFYACYEEDGGVSRERTAKLASYYAGLGVKGLYVCGSSGECIYQSVEERKAILESVVEAVGGKLTIIAHIAAPSTADSIELARHAEKTGADAIAMIPGVYYGLSVPMVKKYWCDVIDATDAIPMFIYNIPGTTNGFNLPTPLFLEMLETGRVAGVKNSSVLVTDIHRLRAAGGEDVAIFNGPDEQYLAGRVMGASGGIGGTYGYMPELFLTLEESITRGDMEKAVAVQDEITKIIFASFGKPALIAVAKGVLKRRGIDVGSVRAPFLPLSTAEDEALVDTIHERIERAVDRFCR